MCGICGVFDYTGNSPVDGSELRRVRDAMRRRGPDGAGLWIAPDRRIGLGHRRLAIIDLNDRAAQPMASFDGRYNITFNGEIYNYRQLRRGLKADGVPFRTESDTEVLLHLYALRGAEMLPLLRGMYAFAIWDSVARTLFLARDPFGIKPLYYSDDGRSIRFASQVKALLASGRVSVKPDPAGDVGFFIWGAIPEPFTLYESISSVPAGCHLTYALNRPGRPVPYFSLRGELAQAEWPKDASRHAVQVRVLQDALRDSVAHHMVADVPVGVFLSSGRDSATITALASEVAGSRLETVTLGFDEYRGKATDEIPLAEAVASTYQTHHRTDIISRADFSESLSEILEAMDQPTIDGVNAYFIARTAARAGLKVALSGLGGDELLGGYASFTEVPRLARALRPAAVFPALGRWIRYIFSPVISRFTSPKYAGVLEYGSSLEGVYLLRRALFMPWELESLLTREVAREGLGRLEPLLRLRESREGLAHPAQTLAALEMDWYMRNQLLRDTDWAGMAHSVEVRVPFVDVQLLRAAAPFLAERRPPGKQHLTSAPRKALPPSVLERPKTGFGIPVREWYGAHRLPFGGGRGLRGWAGFVHQHLRSVRT